MSQGLWNFVTITNKILYENIGNKFFQVSTDFEGKNAWKLCFAVDGVRLPTGYYFGVSAATGDLSGL
jgi:hypothetical protein